jgi:hypothetical protein
MACLEHITVLVPLRHGRLGLRREVEAQERATGRVCKQHTYEGERLSIVFTTPTGGLVLRRRSPS